MDRDGQSQDTAHDVEVPLGSRADWQRLGAAVRRARIDMGFTNRENFAESAGVSVRTLADLESGNRSNFSNRVLTALEMSLGWPSGTVSQIVSDQDFQPPAAGTSGAELIFRPPVFSRRPVPVDIALIDRSIIALTEASRASEKPSRTEASLGSALVALCWPYIARLVEDNCLPGKELHPSVRPIYEAFTKVANWVSPDDPTGRYAQWLAGDDPDIQDQVRTRYMQRWSESRKAQRGRRTDSSDEAAPVTRRG